MKRLVVTDADFPGFEHERWAAREAEAEFELLQCKSEEQAIQALAQVDVAIVQYAPITEAGLAAMRRGGAVVRYGIGHDNVDVEAASRHGISVANVPDYGIGEVADHTMALILSLLRQIPDYDSSVRQGRWEVYPRLPVKSFDETVIGFLGFGRIGRAVHGRLRAFGFTVKVHDPNLSKSDAEILGVELVDKHHLAAESDAITLHAPLSPETYHIIDESFLQSMRRNSALVNTSRGGLINAHDLAAALSEGTIARAALDVFEEEPLSKDHPLRSAPNLIMTPHAAFYSSGSLDRLQRLASEEALRALRGHPLRCPVN